jgi:hypothetical protein
MNSGILFHRPPMFTRRLTVETVTAITRKSERRIKDSHTSTSYPHLPPSLSSSFIFYPEPGQLTTAAHRPHGRCCSWEMWMRTVHSSPRFSTFLHRALLLVMCTVLSTSGVGESVPFWIDYPLFYIPHPPLDLRAALVDFSRMGSRAG